MLSIKLAVLQTLNHNDWYSLGEISKRTMIQEQATAEALHELSYSGVVEFRSNISGGSGSDVIEWRSLDHSLEIT